MTNSFEEGNDRFLCGKKKEKHLNGVLTDRILRENKM